MVTAPGLLECGSHCLDCCYDVWGQKVERRRYPPRQQHPHAWSEGDGRRDVCRHHHYYYRLAGG